MKREIDALRAEFEAMPFAARLAGAAYAERVFSLLDAMQEEIDRLKAGGLPSIQQHGDGKNEGTNRGL